MADTKLKHLIVSCALDNFFRHIKDAPNYDIAISYINEFKRQITQYYDELCPSNEARIIKDWYDNWNSYNVQTLFCGPHRGEDIFSILPHAFATWCHVISSQRNVPCIMDLLVHVLSNMFDSII